jgi:Tfp pilus assembly protein PilP
VQKTPAGQKKTATKTNAAVPAVQPKPAAKGGPKVTTTKTAGGAPATTSTPTVKELGRPATAEKPKPTATRALGAHGRRDPFISPIRNLGNVAPAPTCTSGKRCLAIPELILQGTVKDVSGKMLAVVSNSSHRTYFLRENDQVFNGGVEKITSDSIVFREFVKDALGRETAHEVVKKLTPTQ